LQAGRSRNSGNLVESAQPIHPTRLCDPFLLGKIFCLSFCDSGQSLRGKGELCHASTVTYFSEKSRIF
jgi:hypothetical protein